MKQFINLCILIFILFIWSILDFETSPFYFFSTILDKYHSFELTTKEINIWAIRGQIGDILAGYFSALAFFAIALSIYFQSEGNKQIQESIKQQKISIETQNTALKLQYDALNAQIDELKESRKESEKQTEEFFISNMNVKLDRYYKILDVNLEIVSEEYLYDYLEKMNAIIKFYKLNPQEHNQQNEEVINKYKIITNKQATKIRAIVMTLNFIYGEIIKIKKSSPLVYQTYIEELRLRLHLNEIFRTIHTSIEEYSNIPVFDLYKEQK